MKVIKTATLIGSVGSIGNAAFLIINTILFFQNAKKVEDYLYDVMYDHREYQKKWREAHKGYQTEWARKHKGRYREKQKNSLLMKNYGITIEQYNELFSKQNGCCKICNRHQSEFKRSLAVDHDHETNKVRGLLCHHCNSAIGHFFENPQVMENAITYIKETANKAKS